jgi:hypothetical protein
MIALATYRGAPALSDDDRLLLDELDARGLRAEARLERRLGALDAIRRVRDTLYARVDGCLVDGAFVLTELELVEPALFLGLHEEAARRLAAEVTRRLGA